MTSEKFSWAARRSVKIACRPIRLSFESAAARAARSVRAPMLHSAHHQRPRRRRLQVPAAALLGQPHWISSISRRSRVEGRFGDLKDRSRVALTRGGFRVMRLCKSSVMLAIYAAATNLRLLDTWAARTGLDEPPALTQAHSATPHADSEESPPRPSREPPPGSL